MCIFCKIINNEIPSYKIYEDEYTLAFLDLSQATKGHTLIVPKKHFANIFETPCEELHHIMNSVKAVTEKLKKSLGVENVNILNNSGTLAGQTVHHLHFHIIPRYENDNCELCPSATNPSFDELKNLCDLINN